MAITLFIIGIIAFIACFCLLFYLVDIVEYWATPFTAWGTSFLTLLFYSYGHLIFEPTAQKWILLSAAAVSTLVYLIYSIWAIHDNSNYHLGVMHLLFMIPPIALEIAFVVHTFVEINLSWLNAISIIIVWVLIVVGGCASLLMLWVWGYLKGKSYSEKEYKKEIVDDLQVWETPIANILFATVKRQDLLNTVFSVQMYLQSEEKDLRDSYHLSAKHHSKIADILKALPNGVSELISKRIVSHDLYKTALYLQKNDFQRLIAPELFSSETSNLSNDVQARLFEDLPTRISDLIISRVGVSSLSEVHIDKQFQIQIREVFHSLLSPIEAISNSIAIINNSKDRSDRVDFNGILDENLLRITTNSKVISALLYAYRGVAFSTEYPDTTLPVKEFLTETAKSIIEKESKNVLFEIDDDQYVIIGYTRNLIFALLLPLIQNSIEASPDGETVYVQQRRFAGYDEIRIINKTNKRVNIDSLRHGGNYTTKTGHEGLGLDSVRSIAQHLNIEFDFSYSDKTFIACLRFPVKKVMVDESV